MFRKFQMFSNLKRQDGEKVSSKISLGKNLSSIQIYFSMSIRDLAGVVTREKQLVFALILLSLSDKIYAKNSVVDSIRIRIQDFGQIWIRIQGSTINFEEKIQNNFRDK